MQLTAFRKKLQRLIDDLPAEAERLCIAQAQSGLTIVKNRSTNKGIFVSSKEGNYADYSKNKVLTKRFIGKQRNQSGTEFIKKNRLATWHEFRKAQGLTSEKVNLSYTNRMWSSMGIIATKKINGNGFQTIIGSTDSRVDVYLPKLAERYGNFINPTTQESLQLQKDTIVDLLQFIKRNL